jgi:hypothetical protein
LTFFLLQVAVAHSHRSVATLDLAVVAVAKLFS